ncbi:uncharacterized protein V6R79_019561 [Siganus canaliculatus]
MTACSCDAESDKLISKSLWYQEKRENGKERERVKDGSDTSGASRNEGEEAKTAERKR